MNFSKAILLLEELIIHKNQNENNLIGHQNHLNQNNKEWICLKRLHEASGNIFLIISLIFIDSTGSQNLMLDEMLIIEEKQIDMDQA